MFKMAAWWGFAHSECVIFIVVKVITMGDDPFRKVGVSHTSPTISDFWLSMVDTP